MNISLKIHMVDNYDFGKPHTKYTNLTICIHLQSKMRYKWSKTHITLVHKEIFVIILELFFILDLILLVLTVILSFWLFFGNGFLCN